MTIEMTDEELSLIIALKDVYRARRNHRRYTTDDSNIAQIEVAGTRLMFVLKRLEMKHKKKFIATVSSDEIVIYMQENCVFVPVNYAEKTA